MSVRPAKQDRSSDGRWRVVFFALPLAGVLCLALLLLLQGRNRFTDPEPIPVNLHSQLEADYRANPNPTRVPGVRLDIIWDTIYDREPEAKDLAERQTALNNALLTPVPTVTPSFQTCRGIHFVYADQDTWTDSAEPETSYGTGTSLQLGRSGSQIKRVLLHFPVEDVLPRNALIHNARLEMDVVLPTAAVPPGPLDFHTLSHPFGELNTNWSNQPQTRIKYRADELTSGSIHVWDVTDIVRDWLSGRSGNEGLVIGPQSASDYSAVYYSREIISQLNPDPDGIAIPVGPRLVITCGGELPIAVAVNLNTPTPTATSKKPAPSSPAAETDTPVVPQVTASVASPAPTTVANTPPVPSPTALGPTPSPAPTEPPPTPVPPLPPPTSTPSPVPPPDGGGSGGGGGGPPPPPPPASADLALSKSGAPDPVVAGNSLTYSLDVTNNGPDTATNVTLTDTLPPGVSLVSTTVSQGPGCSGSATVVCSLGSLSSGSSATVTILVAVNASTTGSLTNSANVSAGENDPAPSNNSGSTTTTVNAETDLVVTKTDSSDPVVAGSSLTYTLTAANTGPSDATGLTLTDTLPLSTTFSSATAGCNHASGTVSCSLGNLAAGASSQITIAITVSPTLMNGTVISNTATISGSETDPLPGNNSTVEPTTINKVTDLSIGKTDAPDPVVAGQILTYTLAITNSGPSDASGVTITDTLPAGVTFVSAPGCIPAGSIVTCNIPGTLSVGAGLQRTIVVTVGSSTSGPLANQATVGGNETDPAPGNNTVSISTTVNSVADLSLAKLVSNATPDVGSTLLFTVTVLNSGPSDATSVTVSDPLSTGYTFASATPSQGSYASGSGLWTVGTISANSNVTLTLAVTVNAGGIYTNYAEVQSSSAADPNSTPGNGSTTEDDDATVSVTPIPVTDLAITKVDNPDPVTAGQTLTYTLAITNIGPSDASGLTITDTLPAGVSFASTSFGCSEAAGIVTCTIASLNDGNSLQRTIVVTVSSGTPGPLINSVIVGGNETDPVGANNSDTIATTVQAVADLAITKVDSPDPVTAGETLTYTLAITNFGPSDASGVTITDTLPAGVSFASASFGCSEAAGIVTCTIASLNSGNSLQRTIVVTVSSGTPGPLINSVIVGGNETDPVGANNSDTIATTVQAVADLAITKADSPDPVTAGETLTYTLAITNLGPSDASGVTITDTLPAGVSFASASFGCSEAAGIVTCTIANLNAGNSLQRTIVVTVSSGTAGPLTNLVTIDGNETDPVGANNSDTIATTVQAVADLAITKADSPDPVTAGETLTYTLAITNFGPSDASGVTITDTLPAGVSFASASGGCSEAAGIVTCTIASLNAGNSLQRAIVVTVGSSTTGTLTNLATIGGNETDPVAGNNTDTITTTVQAVGDLAIGKSDSPDPVVAGEVLTYTLSITNTGPSLALGLVVTDTLPSEVSFGSASAGCTNVGGTVSCVIAALAAGSSIQRTIVVTVNSATTATVLSNVAQLSSVTPDPMPGNNTDVVTTTVSTSADLELSKSDSPDPVTAGQTLTYTLTITNNGPSAAQNVVVTDTLPLSVTLLGTTPATNTQNGQELGWNLGTLANGASQTIIIPVTVDSARTTPLANTAIVTSTTDDPNTGNNMAPAVTGVNTETDLAVSKVASVEPATAGSLLTYTIAITNFGPSNATGVTITDSLAGAVTFTAASPGCVPSGGVVSCSIGALSSGSSVQRTIVVTVNSSTTVPFTNTVIVAGNESDPNSANNSATMTTTVQTLADLEIVKSDNPDPVIAGQNLTYTLSITNNGPSESVGLTITDTLPLSVTFNSVSSGCSQAGGVVSCTTASLGAGTSTQITVSVTVGAAVSGVITNTAEVSSTVTDPTPANNNVTEPTTVNGEADLAIVKHGSTGSVVPGGMLTYTLTVFNRGPSYATNVVVNDTLPLSVTLVSSATTQGACSGTSAVSCNLGTMVSSSTVTITLVVTTDTAVNGTLTNLAGVATTTTDPVPPNNTATEVTNIGSLAISKSSSATGPLIPGQVLTYTISVQNIGSAIETGVTISDTVPAGTSYVGGSTLITSPLIYNVLDEFNAVAYNGNDGTQNWSSDWQELGESNGPGTPQVRVSSGAIRCVASQCLRLGDFPPPVNLTGYGATRLADLSGVNAAILSYTYGIRVEDGTVTTVTTAISSSATITWTTLQAYPLVVPVNSPTPRTFNITPYIGPSTELRFMAESSDGTTDNRFFADNVEITYSKGLTTTTGGPPPTLASGFTLLPGDLMTTTFRVVVDDPLTPTITAITNTATVTSDLQTTSLSATATDVIAQADLTISKSDRPDPVVAGQTLTYTLAITNNGPAEAQNVVVTDTLPLSLTVLGTAPPTTTQTGQDLGWDLGTLTNGASQTLLVNATVNPAFSGTLTNSAVVTSTTSDPTLVDNVTTITTTASPSADLELSKSDNPDPVVAGRTLTYTLVISNNGPSAAQNVVLTDTLPLSVTVNGTNPATDTQSGRDLGWDLGTLANGASQSIAISVTVDSDFNGALLNLAVANGTTADPGPGPNSNIAVTTVNSEADLTISKSDTPDPVVAGQTLTYTLSITNSGPSDASNVVVTDTLPVSLTVIGTNPATDTQSGPDLGWNLGTLVNGASQTILLSVTVDSGFSGVLTNTAIVSGSTTDPGPGVNTATATTTVSAQLADLSISKADSADPAIPGQVLTYTLTVTNNGPADATGLTITDTLPLSVTFGSASSGCAETNGVVTCTVASLTASATGQFTVSVTVDSGFSGVLTNTAGVTTPNDSILSNNIISETTTISASVDLAIIKAASPGSAIVGQALTYTLIISNHGPSTAGGVVVSDTLPGGVTFGSATASQGGCGEAGGIVTCNLGSVTNTGNIIVQSTFDTDADDWTIFDNDTSVTPDYFGAGGNPGGYIRDNDDSGSTWYFEAPAKFLGNQAAAYLGTLDFDLRRNSGTTYSADDVILVGGGLTLTATISAPGTGWTSFSLPLHESTWTNTGTGLPPTRAEMLSVLANLAKLRLRGEFVNGADTESLDNVVLRAPTYVTIVVTPTAAGPLVNNAGVTANEPDPDPSNNTDTANTTVSELVPDLTISKTDNPDPATAGKALTYTLTISNNGTMPATGVVVTDTLPAGVNFAAVTSSQGSCGQSGGVVTCTLGAITDTIAQSTFDSNDDGWQTTSDAKSNPTPIYRTVGGNSGGHILGVDGFAGASFNFDAPAKFLGNQATAYNGALTFDLQRSDGDGTIPDPPADDIILVGGGLTLTRNIVAPATDWTSYRIPLEESGWTNSGTGLAPTRSEMITVLSSLTTLQIKGEYLSSSEDIGYLDNVTLKRGPATITIVVTPTISGTIVNSATVSSDTVDPTPGDNTAAITTTVNTLVADLAVNKTVDNAAPLVGDTITFTITINNSGPNDATNVGLSDPLPAGLGFVSDSSSQGSYNSGTGLWVAGTITSTASVTLTLVATATSAGTFTNTAQITASDQTDIDSTPGNNVETEDDQDSAVITTTLSTADLTISKSGDPDPVNGGEALTYTIIITNSGPSDAQGLVSDTLPVSVSLNSMVPSQGLCVALPTSPIILTCDLGLISVGGSAVVTVVVTVDGSLTTTLINTAEVTSTLTDPIPADNTTTITTTVSSNADLSISKADNLDPFTVGQTLSYTLTITNNGPSDATGLTITDTLPTGVTFGSASAGCVEAGGPVNCTRASLTASGTAQFTITVNVISTTTTAAKMYWVDYGTDKIQRANLDGSNIEDLITTGLGRVYGIDLDASAGKMYWTDNGTNKIQRANLDGSNIEDLITTGLSEVQDIVLDVAGGKMYWTDYTTEKVQRANLDGSNIEDLITPGPIQGPVGIALDVAAGKMYWTDWDTGKIQRANLNGSNIEDLVTTGLSGPASIVLDIPGDKMYWTDRVTNKIQRANLDGSIVEDLVTGLSDPHGLDLDLAAGKMYWTDSGTDKIQRANLDGSTVEDQITGLSIPRGIALESPVITNNASVTANEPDSDLSNNTATESTAVLGASLSITNTMVTEGDPPTTTNTIAIFTVSLSAASSQTVFVDYSTADDTATAGSDYQATAGTLTFAPGTTVQTFTVVITSDLIPEGAGETFIATLSNPNGATIANGEGTGTILEDLSGMALPSLPARVGGPIFLPLISKSASVTPGLSELEPVPAPPEESSSRVSPAPLTPPAGSNAAAEGPYLIHLPLVLKFD